MSEYAFEGRLVASSLPDDPAAAAIRNAGGEAQPHRGEFAEKEQAQVCVDLALDVFVRNAGILIANAESDISSAVDLDAHDVSH